MKAKTDKKQGFLQKLVRYKTLLLMLLPSAALVLIFSYLPIGGLVMAFKRFNYADGIFGSPWVGLDNFRFFFESGKALLVTRNTALYNLAFILINTVLEIAFAIILSEMAGKWMKKLTQSIIFLPYFISWVIVGSIAYSLLSYETGTLNGVLKSLGINPVNFYGESGWWPLIIVAFSAWKGVGYGVVVYLAAILGVDASQHEAAAIDGAGDFSIFLRLIWPLYKPVIATIGLFTALTYWNDWYNSMLFINNDHLYSLQYQLYKLLNDARVLRQLASEAGIVVDTVPIESMKMALTVVVTGPIVLLYPFVQRYFIKGLTLGAVKG